MEQATGQLESTLSALDFDSLADDGSATEAEEQDQAAQSEPEEVAPPEAEDGGESADSAPAPDEAAPPTAPAPEPVTPPINYDSDDNPYKQQADKLTSLFEQAAARQAEQEEAARHDAYMAQALERVDYLNNNFGGTDEQRQAEIRNLLGSVEQEIARQASQHIEVKHQDAENAAATAAGLHMAIANDPILSDADKQRLLGTGRYLRALPSPDVMKSTVQRENDLRSQFAAQNAEMQKRLAELEAKVKETATAKKVQQRIASGVDSVGTGVGSPASAKKSRTDQTLDRLFGT